VETPARLKEMDVEPERIRLQPMVLPIFKMLLKFATNFAEQVTKMGRYRRRRDCFSKAIKPAPSP